MRKGSRSIATPITVISVAVALALGLLVGWTAVLIDPEAISGTVGLLVLGVVSIAYIVTALVLSAVGLAREILEGRRQRTFIDSVTHELKSPLASLGLGLETLARGDLSPAQRDDVRHMMGHDVARLSAFIDDVLTASRLAHRPAAPALAPVSLGPLVAQAVEKVLPRYDGAQRDSIQVDIEPHLAVTSDPTALETIVKNLVDNALKYSDPPYAVRVTAAREEDQVVLAVHDQGIGIEPASLRHVFRRFYRGTGEDVRSRSGTGLGLYVASELARAVGASIEARSEGRGKGTTVFLHLPLRP
ncbi:MAG: HAMP domain-containing sensor histidine kinase [Myxococcota bacterium]